VQRVLQASGLKYTMHSAGTTVGTFCPHHESLIFAISYILALSDSSWWAWGHTFSLFPSFVQVTRSAFCVRVCLAASPAAQGHASMMMLIRRC